MTLEKIQNIVFSYCTIWVSRYFFVQIEYKEIRRFYNNPDVFTGRNEISRTCVGALLITRSQLICIVKNSNPISIFEYSCVCHSVQGCPDIKPEGDMWFRRSDGSEHASVGCSSTTDSWNLKCVNRNWVGQTENCTTGRLYKKELI